MENYTGLIIAVENYHDNKNLSNVRFAINDATIFLDSLIKLGCDKSKFQILTNNLATKTTIKEKINQISQYATAQDTIVFYYAGHGFYHNGKNLISCVDTSLTSLSKTTISINSILSLFDKSKSNKVIAFLDCCHSGIEFSEEERSPVSEFSTDDLKYEYGNAEHLTVFASCKSEEKSQADFERKHGVWSYFLIEAIKGKAKGIYDGAILFSDKLQKYLADSTYRRVKMITPEKKNQTPVKYGKETKEKFIVADLTKLFERKKIEAKSKGIKFEDATIISNEDDWVRNLPGFKSSHKPPKEISDYHENWIKSISTELIEEELNEVAKELRKRLNYKRKDINEPIVENGIGQLVTIDFDYVVTISQSAERPDKYIITRSIENFKNSDILSNPDFNKLFQNDFKELELRTYKKMNIEKIIDKIEEIDNEELISVEYEQTDLTSCEITINGFDGVIKLSRYTFTVQSNQKKSPYELVLSCQNVYQAIGQQGIQKMLGLSQGN